MLTFEGGREGERDRVRQRDRETGETKRERKRGKRERGERGEREGA